MAERADAARNRRAILRAAEELLTAHGPDRVSLEQVAAAAGVAKGTVFHRFTNKAGLIGALIMERLGAFQQGYTEGPPPLGPGAPARERLDAFFTALVDLVSRNVALMAAHERTSGHRQDNPIYTAWHEHVSGLLREARPDLDAEALGHILLGALHSDLIVHMLRTGEANRLVSALQTVTAALLDQPRGANEGRAAL
ncbi:TetR family transcriptional regulator [Amycolatopsis cynarae]|uniref:TetR family transcriptional regulator n=1 Tax=Amycolatopsis cynarae TaxID=2995223 RepID=A0ABY7B1Z1_9PSEU|nr:TetR family transcriptional regulator [Amycolatopsis sp. HUAS 11-8]WAL65703.1 TetR family transcriptional regulator [Amycolatopsis sp. HUAS 11-8]